MGVGLDGVLRLEVGTGETLPGDREFPLGSGEVAAGQGEVGQPVGGQGARPGV